MTTFKVLHQRLSRRLTLAPLLALIVLSGLGVSAAPALASGESAWWHLTSGSQPAKLPPGGEGTINVMVSNLGDAPIDTETSPITFTDTLPAGLTATEALAPVWNGEGSSRRAMTCTIAPDGVTVTCTYAGSSIQPYEALEVRITVKVDESARSGELNAAEMTGGGVPPASVKRPIVVDGSPSSFGVERYEISAENANGKPETQAGSHPFQLTTSFMLNENAKPGCQKPSFNEECLEQPALPKDLRFDLPPGLVGDPTAFPQCGEAQFVVLDNGSVNSCPADTVLGVALVTLEIAPYGYHTVVAPVFNLPAEPGEPARFGFVVHFVPVTLETSVRTGRNYGIVVSSNNISELPTFVGAQVTFWGVPGDIRHDNSRGWFCLGEYGPKAGQPCTPQNQQQPPAFLTLPTSCTSSLLSPMEADSWKEPANAVDAEPTSPLASLDGCDELPFSAGIETAPDLQQSSTPTGLKVDVHVPQDATLDTNGVAGADVKNIDVTLPEGVTLNPSGADGLEACSEPEIGFEGAEPGSGLDLFSPGLPAPKGAPAQPFCPDAAKIATAKITTPLLPHPLEGSVYLAAQNENPFGSLVAMYLVAEDPVSGVLVKLPGEVSLNQATGQITASFLNNPQLPFEDAELHFFGGDRAPLSTPAHCGSYTTQASFTPWSGNAPIQSSSTFDIIAGPNGGPCPAAALPFAPSLTAGNTSNSAGGFSPFTMTMSREDGNQNLKAVVLHMPPGLSGDLTGIPLCGEAQADAGTCSTASLIGETTVSVGLGSNPYTVTGGKVYLTGPYEGAPFGLSIVNPANAGPFHLGNVIVRAKIEVDPHTAALTVTSDASGPYAIPPSLDGIPLQIKHINVTINHPGFTFNPTNCNPQSITGTLTSIEGATATLPVSFQSTNCAALKFAPSVSFSTSGKTSKADGADLITKITYPSAPQGTYANVGYVKVELPKQLPSRLTTLQKACTDKQFESNPAGCPAESKIGYAIVHTPLIPVPLEGPAIFVSHGGEAFPSLTMVLQGYGLTIDLVGTTFISKSGVTSTTFKAVPDQPFSSFELVLPQGPFSALAANGNLCSQKLVLPNEFVSQAGGNPLKQDSTVAVTGCKPAITVKSHKVKGITATISVSVPTAGKLVATSKGLSKASKSATKASTLTVKLTLTKAEVATLKKHRGRKLRARIKLTFSPKKGSKLTTATTVLIG